MKLGEFTAYPFSPGTLKNCISGGGSVGTKYLPISSKSKGVKVRLLSAYGSPGS